MAAVHLIRRDGSFRAETIASVEGEIADVYTVEVDDETLARWRTAEETRKAADEAYREAMKSVRAVEDEMDALYDEAEDSFYASLPPRDPDAPPPGPIRDLFPTLAAPSGAIIFHGGPDGPCPTSARTATRPATT